MAVYDPVYGTGTQINVGDAALGSCGAAPVYGELIEMQE